MQTFEQIQQQIADLQKQAIVARKEEVAVAIKEIKRLVAMYGLTAADVGLAPSPFKTGKAAKPNKLGSKKTNKAPKVKKSAGDKRATVAPKFRDPQTGQSWSGRGKPPTWLAEKIAAGASKESFRI